MYRTSIYALLFIVVMLLQVFLFDRLSLSVAISPLVYIAFLTVFPIQCSQLEMLFWGTLLGVSADIVMGMAGLNCIATIFVCYIRVYLMGSIFSKDQIAQGGVPLLARVGAIKYTLYITLMVVILNLVFFTAESINVRSWLFTLERTALSSLVATPFVWLLSVIFGKLLIRKI